MVTTSVADDVPTDDQGPVNLSPISSSWLKQVRDLLSAYRFGENCKDESIGTISLAYERAL